MAIVIKNKQTFSTPAVTMIAMCSIASPVGLVIMAQYGIHALFYYLAVILFFFIPSAFVFSELGSGFPQEGGIYNWVTKAFGHRIGNIAMWSQWLTIIFTFPVILSFTFSLFVYPFFPHLIHDNDAILIGTIALMCIATLLTIRSIHFSAILSYFAAAMATIIPVILLIILAIIWLSVGKKPLTPLDTNIIPHITHFGTFALLGATVLMFAGIELSANCIHHMKNPKRDYGRAIFFAALFVSLISIFGTLAISVLVPKSQTNLIAGLIQAFVSGSDALGISWLPYVMGCAMTLGQIGMLSIFLMTLSKGLHATAKDGLLPHCFTKENKRGMPINLILTLAGIAMLISLLFVISPRVHQAYWLIEAIAVVINSFRYLLVFPAAIRLRYKHPEVERLIAVPGGKLGIWIFAGLAFLMLGFGTSMTFIPPAQFTIGSHALYETILIGGALFCVIVPLLIAQLNKPRS